MTTAQLAILKNDITVTRAAVNFAGDTLGNHFSQTHTKEIADFYNQTASPQSDIWKPNIAMSDALGAVVMTEFILLTVAKQNGWFALTSTDVINATIPNVRNSFVTIFGASASLTALTAVAMKPGTYFESLFSTSQVSAVFGQTLGVSDVFLLYQL